MKDAEQRGQVGLILLLRRPWDLDLKKIERYAEHAWKNEEFDLVPILSADREDTPSDQKHLIISTLPSCLLVKGGFRYVVTSIDEPYWYKPENRLEDPRLHKALDKHEAFVSVELEVLAGQKVDETFRIIAGKEIAELVAQLGAPLRPLALYSPAHTLMVLWNSALRQKLAGPDPLSAFGMNRALIPDELQPAYFDAVRQAQQRWPEFVEEFYNEDAPPALFVVKGLFTEGDIQEQVWLRIEEIFENEVQGVIVNEPGIVNVEFGKKVTVDLEDLTDWAILRKDGHVGYFTEGLTQIHFPEPPAGLPQNRQFVYSAETFDGKWTAGRIEAQDRQTAEVYLAMRGYSISRMVELEEQPSLKQEAEQRDPSDHD